MVHARVRDFEKYRGVGNADKITFVLYKRGKIVSPYLLRRTLHFASRLQQHLYYFTLLFASRLQTFGWKTTLLQHHQVVSDHIVTISHACRWWGIIIISSQFRWPHTPFLLYLIQVSICFLSSSKNSTLRFKITTTSLLNSTLRFKITDLWLKDNAITTSSSGKWSYCYY